jgi:hypothetical protein
MGVQADGSEQDEKIGGYPPTPPCFSQRVRKTLIWEELDFRYFARD